MVYKHARVSSTSGGVGRDDPSICSPVSLAERRESGCLRSIISFLAIVAAVLVLSWGIRTFVFQAYGIPSGSMENTIEVGDMVFSEKVTYYGG